MWASIFSCAAASGPMWRFSKGLACSSSVRVAGVVGRPEFGWAFMVVEASWSRTGGGAHAGLPRRCGQQRRTRSDEPDRPPPLSSGPESFARAERRGTPRRLAPSVRVGSAGSLARVPALLSRVTYPARYGCLRDSGEELLLRRPDQRFPLPGTLPRGLGGRAQGTSGRPGDHGCVRSLRRRARSPRLPPTAQRRARPAPPRSRGSGSWLLV